MKNWMKKLADTYEKIKTRHPRDRLLILFDIDGTIVDTRYMILSTLKKYDQRHETQFFDKLQLDDIRIHENHLEHLLSELEFIEDIRKNIRDWYTTHFWSPDAIPESHKPYEGVMEVIRWFQIQPNTFVGLNSGRPESLRTHTLSSLNEVGKEYKVRFTDDLLYMNPYGLNNHVTMCKAEAVTYFRNAGYRIFAMVDNEPENLNAVANLDPHGEILLLHADTIFESKRRRLPGRSTSGNAYDITELIQEKSLPQHIQFVWHGVDDLGTLIQFLNSDVQWAECNLRMDKSTSAVILPSHELVEPVTTNQKAPSHFNDILFAIGPSDKSLKLDLKESGPLIEAVIDCLNRHQIDESRLWFNGKVDVLKEAGFRRLKELYPGAILQCPIDAFIPFILESPNEAKDLLSVLRDWGVNRFSLKWNRPSLREILDWLDSFGIDVNIYQVPDLESFLKAVLLMPRSITSDFNFPKWHYFGRESGKESGLDDFCEANKASSSFSAKPITKSWIVSQKT